MDLLAPLALPHFDLRALADAIGYPAAALGILIESIGIPFPGEVMLVAVAAFAAAGHLDIRLVVLLAALGAVAGCDAGYAIGRHGGRPFVERFGRALHINPGHIAQAEGFFHRHGDKAVFLGRFLVGFRTWGSMLAGMSRMPFWRFQLFSALGSVLWAIVFGTLGYTLGNNWSLLERILRLLGYGGAALALVLVGAVIAVRTRARRGEPTRSR